MAISTTGAYSGPYITNGLTQAFPFTFEVLDPAHVQVILRTDSGAESIVTPSLYTVALSGPSPSIGTVTFTTAPVTGQSLFVLLNPPFTQDTQFEDGSGWLADPENDVHDMAALRDQVLLRDAARAVKVPIGETAGTMPPRDERANMFLGFDVEGSPVAMEGTGADEGLRGDLSALNGASLIGYNAGLAGAVTHSLQSHLSRRLHVADFGALADGATPAHAGIALALAAAAARAAALGGMVELCAGPGVYVLGAGIVVPAGVHLTGPATFRASAAMERMIEVQSDAAFTDATVDGNNLATFAVVTTDAQRFKLLRLRFINWKYALVIENKPRDAWDAVTATTSNVETADFEVGWVTFDTPGTVPVYPLWTAPKASKGIHRGKIHDIEVFGRAATPYGAGGTADQLELQGLVDSEVWNVRSRDGGELGFAIVRLSRNVVATNIHTSGADADGVQIGSAYGSLTFADTTGLEVGDYLLGATSGAGIVVEFIRRGTNEVFGGALLGNWQAGENAVQCIRLAMVSVNGLKVGDVLTGATSGGKGTIVKITDPENPKAPKQAYVSWNGVDDIDFIAGENASNGTVTQAISAVNHTPAIASTVTKAVTAKLRAHDITLKNVVCMENGNDVAPKSITIDAVPTSWAVGDIITGLTSGATATLDTNDSATVYLSAVSGTFTDGETVQNGAAVAYTVTGVGGIFAGIKVQHIDRPSITLADCVDARTAAKQKYGIYYSQAADIFESGNNLAKNKKAARSINGVCSFQSNTMPANLVVNGSLSLARGKNLVVASEAITVTAAYHNTNGTVKTINGGTEDGQLLMIGWDGIGSGLTLRDAASGGNIDLAGDQTFDSTTDAILLSYRLTAGRWRAVAPLANN